MNKKELLYSTLNKELSEILEDSEIQDNELSKVLENTEDINDESSQLRTLNKQKVNEDQQRESMTEDESDNTKVDNISNGDNESRALIGIALNESENNNSDEDDKSNEDNESENNNTEFFEDYSCPSFEPFRESNIAQTNNKFFIWAHFWNLTHSSIQDNWLDLII
ncbi:hypothetical protein C1646_822624 [Rhizophagus diaphanus]|nr:hypothetical protein C1646_822624 [Rhizophagus diaphanus] [Rhizophagus sp. MUCL 43196]